MLVADALALAAAVFNRGFSKKGKSPKEDEHVALCDLLQELSLISDGLLRLTLVKRKK
jgi:hypothetical protein